MKSYRTVFLTITVMLLCSACASHDASQASRDGGGVSALSGPFIRSEEIQNPKDLKLGGVVIVKPDARIPYGSPSSTNLTVHLPSTTPYPAHSEKERSYLKGYALGYLDAVNQLLVCRSNAGDRLVAGWNEGWEAGFTQGTKNSVTILPGIIQIGMKEAEAIRLLQLRSLAWGRVYYGGSGSGRLYFQPSTAKQFWLEIGGAPDFVVMAISSMEAKSTWHHPVASSNSIVVE